MGGAIEKVSVAKNNVPRPSRDLLPDVSQHRFGWHDQQTAVVYGHDWAVPAEVLAALGGLGVANQLRYGWTDIARVGLQRRQGRAIGHGRGGALQAWLAVMPHRGYAEQI